MPLSPPFSWCSQPQVSSCISPKPLPASTPGRRAGLGPPQQPRDFSTEFCFWYYFYALVLISHVGSASRFGALTNLIHLLWKALRSSSHPCLQSTQGTMAFSQICPTGTSVIEGVTHPWSPAPDPGGLAHQQVACRWIMVHKLCAHLPLHAPGPELGTRCWKRKGLLS